MVAQMQLSVAICAGKHRIALQWMHSILLL